MYSIYIALLWLLVGHRLSGTQARCGQDWADTLCSSVVDQDQEKKHVVRALKRNGYPSGVMPRSETGRNRRAQSRVTHQKPQKCYRTL